MYIHVYMYVCVYIYSYLFIYLFFQKILLTILVPKFLQNKKTKVNAVKSTESGGRTVVRVWQRVCSQTLHRRTKGKHSYLRVNISTGE